MKLFQFCNENLNAIITGLDSQKNDRILCVGGSGDQALALLEYGCDVFYIDSNKFQTQYFLDVLKKLKNNNLSSFLQVEDIDDITNKIRERTNCEVDYFEQRKIYFNDVDKFNKICSNLGNLHILDSEDIFTFVKNTDFLFSKIYLSDIFTTKFDNQKYDFKYFSNDLESLCSCLIEGGLLYFSDGLAINNKLKKFQLNSFFINKFSLKNINLIVDKNKTKKSRKFEIIFERKPLVLRFEKKSYL